MITNGKPELARGESPLLQFRPYQLPVFLDRTTGILVLHWARQIGKSFTLAAWAVDRLLTQLQRHPAWLVTVLSNSRDNGGEFVRKCAEVCHLLGVANAEPRANNRTTRGRSNPAAAPRQPQLELVDDSPNIAFENMRMEVRIALGERVGRIKVLAANPRTARGFSGDLILDEFAFHEDSGAIWEAAEPILSAHPEYLCRIASTGNGKYNLFYRLVTSGQFKVIRVSRTDAWQQGVAIFDPNHRRPITPAAARAQALDKRAYDQNYELAFMDENSALLTLGLIGAAERGGGELQTSSVDDQAWSETSLERMAASEHPLFIGNDIGRHRDLSVVTVIERAGPLYRVAGILRMSGLRLPAQQAQLDLVCGLPRFTAYEGDITGLGLGLVEYLQEKWGRVRIRGVNFASTEPITPRLQTDGRTGETARVTEIMATRLLELFEDRVLEIPVDHLLREDLRKPEKITTPSGQVSVAATREEAGHADHFWSLALAVRAADPRRQPSGGLARAFHWRGSRALAARRRL